MQPINPVININLQTLAPIGRLAYQIDGVENNPTLELVRGYTYRLLVTAAAPYSFWIKTELGLGSSFSYNQGVLGNGTAEITWRVSEDAPARLAYQAYGAAELSGCISISDQPSAVANDIDSYATLSQALDFIDQSLCFSPKNIAGQGLTLVGSTLTLVEPSTRYLTSSTGDLYTTQSSFVVSDGVSALQTPPTDLQTWLNYLAASLRQLKGTGGYTATSATIPQINSRIDNLFLELAYLNQRGT